MSSPHERAGCGPRGGATRWRSFVDGRQIVSILITAVTALVVPAPSLAGTQPRVEGGVLDFRLPDLDGNPVDAADARFDGRVVLVDLWATWCPPCLSEIPTFVDLQKRLGDRGLTIVGIAFEAEEEPEVRRERLRAFAQEHDMNYLVLDGGTPDALETALPGLKSVRGFPVEILIDRRGRVTAARNGYGFKRRWARKLERELEELLSVSDD